MGQQSHRCRLGEGARAQGRPPCDGKWEAPPHDAGVETALLILILTAGDPGSAAAGAAVAAALREQDAKATIVLPPDSAVRLAERGLKDADLVSRSEKPVQATANDLKLVIVRVERRSVGTDKVVDVELWSGGRSDRMSAVTGTEGEPEPPAAEGARRLLREATHDPVTAAEHADFALIATYADRADWKGLIAAIAARSDARPRLLQVAVLAHLRLGDQAGAQTALAALRKAYPDHPFIASAAAAVDADPGGSDTLRDGAGTLAMPDSNILR